MYTVEIRSGFLTDNVRVHTWLYITHPDGNTEAWGFYPADTGLSGLNASPYTQLSFPSRDLNLCL